jgi:prepilin peptidase CpaA
MRPEVVLLLAVCAIAVYTDVQRRIIPNWLTAGCAGVAIVLLAVHGWAAAAVGLAAGGIIFTVGCFAHSARVLGGGDVKLLAAGSVALGFPDCLFFVLYTFLSGGLLAVGFALAQGRLRTSLINVRTMAQTRTLMGESPASARMPYALAIAAGAVATALANTILPALRFPT